MGEILENTSKHDWRWVPTQQNVADDATRINSSLCFESTGRWFIGPQFLKQSEKNWPKESIVEASETDLEVIESINITNHMPFLLKFDCYSTIIRMIRIVAWILRFVERLRLKVVMSGV